METWVLTYHPNRAELIEVGLRFPQNRAAARSGMAWGVGFVLMGSFVATERRVLGVVLIIIGILQVVDNAVGWSARRALRRHFDTIPDLESSVVLSADITGISQVSRSWQMQLDWAHFDRVIVENDGLAIVGRSPSTVRWIPVRAFTSHDEMRALGRDIEHWIRAAGAASPAPGRPPPRT